MTISYSCPYCAHVGQTADKYAGATARCPKCKEAFLMPELEAQPEANMPSVVVQESPAARTQNRSKSRTSGSPSTVKRSSGRSSGGAEPVEVVGVNIPFLDMMRITFLWSLAATPAIILCSVIFFFVAINILPEMFLAMLEVFIEVMNEAGPPPNL